MRIQISKTIKSLKGIYIPIAIIMLACTIGQTQAKLSQDQIKKSIDTHASLLLLDERINSVSIGVHHNGSSTHHHYGEMDKGMSNPPNDSTIYDIASITKTMTGTLVAQAVLDGKLKLDDDIRLYLDDEYRNLHFRNQAVKVKHLLTHTSRLPANIPGVSELFKNKTDSTFFKVVDIYNSFSQDDYLQYLKTVALDTFPGIIYEYCNFGVEVLGHILEQVYNKTYPEILEEKIFSVYNLNSTKCILDQEDLKKYANGYNHLGILTPRFPLQFGSAGAVKSTIKDLTTYAALQLNTDDKFLKESHKKLYQKNPNYSMLIFGG